MNILNLNKYNHVALGGTFDVLHIGHLHLLKESFKVGNFVTIGITSDDFVRTRLNKKIMNPYPIRVQNMRKFIEKEIKINDYNKYEITTLNENFGPLMTSNKIECLIVSSETEEKGKTINHIRSEKGLPIIDIITVKLVLAEDGRPISSSRIRSNEIDTNGFKINN